MRKLLPLLLTRLRSLGFGAPPLGGFVFDFQVAFIRGNRLKPGHQTPNREVRLTYVRSICLAALVVMRPGNSLAQELNSDVALGEPLQYEEGGFHRGVTELNVSAGAGFGMAVI